MTPKEEIRSLLYEIYLPMADREEILTLLDQIDDRAGEMEEWIIKRQKESTKQMGVCLREEPNYEYWRGCETSCRLFLDHFDGMEISTIQQLSAREWHDYE